MNFDVKGENSFTFLLTNLQALFVRSLTNTVYCNVSKYLTYEQLLKSCTSYSNAMTANNQVICNKYLLEQEIGTPTFCMFVKRKEKRQILHYIVATNDR